MPALLLVAVLHTLSASEGNILDDASAIEILGDSKRISNDIDAKQVIADATAKKLDSIREGYQPVAYHSSILYFSIAAMANIDPMYQYSLSFFKRLFQLSLDKSDKAVSDVAGRVDAIISFLTRFTYDNVCRGLFERDSLLFSFLVCCNILLDRHVPPSCTVLYCAVPYATHPLRLPPSSYRC